MCGWIRHCPSVSDLFHRAYLRILSYPCKTAGLHLYFVDLLICPIRLSQNEWPQLERVILIDLAMDTPISGASGLNCHVAMSGMTCEQHLLNLQAYGTSALNDVCPEIGSFAHDTT